MGTVATDIIGKGWSFPFKFSRTGGVERAKGIDLIKMSISQIVLTRVGSRTPNREFGTPLKDLVFAPIQPDLVMVIQHFVVEAIARWEKRVEVRSVQVELANRDRGILEISCAFVVRQTQQEGNMVIPFTLGPEDRFSLGFTGAGNG